MRKCSFNTERRPLATRKVAAQTAIPPSLPPSLPPSPLPTLVAMVIFGPYFPPSTTDRSTALLLARPLFLKLFFLAKLKGSDENCTPPTRAVLPRFVRKQLLF